MSEETVFKPSTIQTRAREFFRRLELPGDALLCIYFAVFTREYLWWGTGDNRVAWIASALMAIVLSSLYVLSKEATEEAAVGLPFWLVVVLPLLLVYAMRVALPDVSFDVLNYHIFHGERTLRGFLYLPGEFFPTPSPFSPAPDMVTGIFRHLLGYRLGTIANFLVVVWLARVLDKLLRPYLPDARLRAAGVLLAVMAEHLLGEINNYMSDLLAVPLLLEATYLTLRHYDYKIARLTFVRIATLLGMSVAFKLTNAAFGLPIVLLCAHHALAGRSSNQAVSQVKKRKDIRQLGITTVLSAVAFFAPLFPFSIYLYRQTGSPIFPVYNGIFKSVYWPASNVLDPRWGPFGLWEKLLWPILISFKPERLSELPIYSGRISTAFIVALIGLVFIRRNGRLRELCLVVVGSSLLWSVSTGYIRYALYLEVMAPIVVLALASKLVGQTTGRFRLKASIASLLWMVLLFHACLGGYYLSNWELSGRSTFFKMPDLHRDEAGYLLRDHSLRDFLSAEELSRFERVEVWIISSIKTSGLAVLLRPDARMIGVNTHEFFQNQTSRDRFARALESAAGKRMFSLAFAEDLEEAIANLQRSGLVAAEVTAVEIPFYSRKLRIPAFLIEVTREGKDSIGKTPKRTEDSKAGLSVSAYRADIEATQEPGVMKAGAKEALHFKVRNFGTNIWPSHSSQGWVGMVTIGDRWLAAAGMEVVNEMDGRAAVQHDVRPGDVVELTLIVTAPQVEGQYVLEIDMVHEGVTWFYQRGSPTLRWTVNVRK